ncbi:hypothetical protein BD309DRAFT_1084793 [Dichomitus squalens]|nr:hypothetical protein BD309DRAFT_1084793 [Dichomitus squalens]
METLYGSNGSHAGEVRSALQSRTTSPTPIRQTATSTPLLDSLSPPDYVDATVPTRIATPLTSSTISQLRPAPFRNGEEPPLKSRPTTHDYIDDVKSLLTDAVIYYSCYLFTEDLFPGPSKQREFVTRAWNAVCSMCETPPLYALSERMIRVIGARKSSIRGDVADKLCDKVADAYGFRRNVSAAAERHNAQLVEGLVKDGAFHYKVLNIATGSKEKYSEHPLITRALEIAFFGNTRSGAGFLRPELFDPIPDQALAFIHTIIHAHICQWSTGRHVREDFSESKNSMFYVGFLADLRAYGSKNPSAWLNIRKRMYSRAFRAGGGATLQVQVARISMAAMDAATAELEGRTGLTDSEDEGEAGPAA